MVPCNPSRQKFVVHHSNWLKPEDLYRFIHLDGFTADWNELKLKDEDLQTLQVAIMVNPTAGPVVAGTGGVRKLRFSPPSSNKGKRGAMRVLYAIFPDYSVAVLAAAYSKSVDEDISANEKKLLKRILAQIADALEEGC